MSKHTPGPWVLREARIYSAQERFIAEAPSICFFEYDFRPANWEANAHLVAAAPEMLEALEKIKALMQEPIFKRAGINMGIPDIIDSALAKARGKA